MYAVYLCGATDCFLSALFMNKGAAECWAKENSKNPEGFAIKYFDTPLDIDTSKIGWST